MRLRESTVHRDVRFQFVHSFPIDPLRRKTRNGTRRRVRQHVDRTFHISAERRFDLVEFEIGANTCELNDAVRSRVGTAGLEVVPEERAVAVRILRGARDRRCSLGSRRA
jgi:hypothetical protein